MYCPGSVAGCRTPESASAPDSRGNLLLTSAICNSMETEGLKPCTAALSSAGSSVKSCNMREDRTSVYTATCCPGCNCLSRYFNISIRAWAWSWTGVFSASSSRIAGALEGMRYSGRLVMTFGGRFARRLLNARAICAGCSNETIATFCALPSSSSVKSCAPRPVITFPSLSVTTASARTRRTETRIAGEGTPGFCSCVQPAGPRTKVSPANEIAATSMRMLCHPAFEHFISHLTRSLPLQDDNASFAVESPLAIRNSNDCRRPRRSRGLFFRPLALFPPFIILYFDAHPYIIPWNGNSRERAGSYVWEEECKLFWASQF